MSYLFNIDNGYGNTKIFGGTSSLSIPTLLKEGDIQLLNETSTISNMVVLIDNKTYIVGDKAAKNRARYNHSANKFSSINNTIPSITSIAYILLKNNINNAEIDITTTLPIGIYTKENINEIANLFRREWEVTFLYGELKGKTCYIKINSNSTTAQSVGGTFDYIIQDNGKVRPVKNVKYLTIDIGYETTDIAVLNNMELDENMSIPLDIGINDYDKKIVQEINKQFNMKKTVEELINEFKLGRIGAIDIKPIQYKYYKEMVEEIKASISGIITNTLEFEDIILIGGGTYRTLNIFKQDKDYNRIITIPDPEYSNVRGSRKLILMKKGVNYYVNI